jgi:hypothetical protein
MYLFMEFCSPAKTYIVIAFLTLLNTVIKNENYILMILLKAICFIGWAFLLNWLCAAGFNAVAWLSAFIPHFLFLLITL